MLTRNAAVPGVVGSGKELGRRVRSTPKSNGTTCVRRALCCFVCSTSPLQDGTTTGSVPCGLSLVDKPPLHLENPM